MTRKRRFFPFNAEQTVNILSEFGPLATMFIVNAVWDINTGTWALIVSTVLAICVMFYMFRRPPVFPLIASTVTIVFGALTILTGDPMWVQIKVTIFNAMFAAFLFIGLWLDRNFFQYVFGKTFHYSQEGWNKFTRSFAWFFVLTAVLNEVVRLTFEDTHIYNVLGHEMSGVNIWIAFKLVLIMPLSGLYAWLLTRWMAEHYMPPPDEVEGASLVPAEVRAGVAGPREGRSTGVAGNDPGRGV
jgi:intracellular septation protein